MSEKVYKAAFDQPKQKFQTKIKDLYYVKINMILYMKGSDFNLDKIKLLFVLRSKLYPA